MTCTRKTLNEHHEEDGHEKEVEMIKDATSKWMEKIRVLLVFALPRRPSGRDIQHGC